MAMRITTKMMQNTSLNNLNTNKALQEKLTTQLSTMKKITRPSDDPVIAIRSLKLNSSLNKIDQYYEKNANDAQNWLELTEASVKTVNAILEDIRGYTTQCATGQLTAEDRQAIMENMSNFMTEIYATGNAQSAGRNIFTGYRTDTSLTFREDKVEKYSIIEQRNNSYMDTITHVVTGDMANINEGNFNTPSYKAYTQYQVESFDVARIRLAYDDLDFDKDNNDKNISLSYFTDVDKTSFTDATLTETAGARISTASYTVFVEEKAPGQDEIKIRILNAKGQDITPTLAPLNPNPLDVSTSTQVSYTVGSTTLTINVDATAGEKKLSVTEDNASPKTTHSLTFTSNEDGNTYKFDERVETTYTDIHYEEKATDEAYKTVYGEANADKITFIAETGEILLGSNVQNKLAALSIEDEIRIGYDKSNWQTDDLDPVHYFYTERYPENRPAAKGPLVYNEEKLTAPGGNVAKQIIEYDIGSNQTIRVNTTAEELFTHNMGRDTEEVLSMLEQFDSLDNTYNTVKKLIDSGKYEGEQLDTLKLQLDALDKAKTLAKKNLQQSCEAMQTVFDGYIDQAKLARTDVGSRESRVKLIQNRLSAQQTSYQELVSDNEDADVTELAIQLNSVELTYEAALSSISYVMKTTLLDFI